ncbi:MAG: efflux RND transporter periplasmic adaptor subunit, partial [Lachnospiraceae bacterium]|nr:efflux RND transporter periplasmic adaptor subunit [Lachnospiraceae bacterium]
SSETQATVEQISVVVDMQQAQSGDLTLQNSFVGNISPQEMVYVIPMATGTVTEVNYSVGDYVNAGDVLFKIDDTGAKLQLEQAKLSATSAKQQVDMANGTQQKSTDLQLQSAQVQAQSAFEQAQIAYHQVKEPYDELSDAIETAEDAVSALETQIEESVSGGDAMLHQQLAVAKSTLSALEAQMDTLRPKFWQAQSAYEAAQAGLDIAGETADLTQGEVRQGTAQQTQTSLALALLGVDSAELALSYYTVTAPISGVIQSRSVEVNGIAASSSPAFTIANENTMTVTFQVSEAVKNTLTVGETILVERNNEVFNGNITEVGVAVNQQTGLFQIKAVVEADGTSLPAGVSAKITADTYSVKDAILIPYDAVYYDNNGSYVYLAVDGKAVKTYVTTGIFDDTTISIIDGIAVGDTVITSWSPRLLDGVEVTAADVAAE